MLLFMCSHVCACKCGAYSFQRGLEDCRDAARVLTSYLTWVLGTALRSFAWASSILSLWAVLWLPLIFICLILNLLLPFSSLHGMHSTDSLPIFCLQVASVGHLPLGRLPCGAVLGDVLEPTKQGLPSHKWMWLSILGNYIASAKGRFLGLLLLFQVQS